MKLKMIDSAGFGRDEWARFERSVVLSFNRMIKHFNQNGWREIDLNAMREAWSLLGWVGENPFHSNNKEKTQQVASHE